MLFLAKQFFSCGDVLLPTYDRVNARLEFAVNKYSQSESYHPKYWQDR